MTVSIPSLVDEIRSGNTRALARAITAIENRAPQSAELLKALFPHTGHARVIGLTGKGRAQMTPAWPPRLLCVRANPEETCT